jgi:simple sugar transport system permease protein
MFKQITQTHEFFIAMTIIFLSIVIGWINPAYFSVASLFDMLRNATVYGILAMGTLVVLISGGIDVSFPAIAAASSYMAVKILIAAGLQGPIWTAFLVALPFGLLLGMLNATFISWFRLPALIVTLGTASMTYGCVLFFVGNLTLYNLPAGMVSYRMMSLMTVNDSMVGTSSLHPSVLVLGAVALGVWILLKFTLIGRGIYALGGNREAAERCGFNVRLIEYAVYCLAGTLASIAGVIQVVLYRNANPAALMGMELDVIAAVVLGGASITGGRGTVIGAGLGLFLITIMKSGLVLVGISSEWQKVAIGIALILGASVPAIRMARRNWPMASTIAE